MAYTHTTPQGRTYFLHGMDVRLKGSGVRQRIYYFSRKTDKHAIDDIPSGYTIVHSKRTGLPLLKKR